MSALKGKLATMISEQVDFANAQLARLRTEYAAAKGHPETQDSLKSDMDYWTQCAIRLAETQETPEEETAEPADAYNDAMSPDSVISVFSPGRPMGMRG